MHKRRGGKNESCLNADKKHDWTLNEENAYIDQLPRLGPRDISIANPISQDRDVVAEFGSDARGAGDADVGLEVLYEQGCECKEIWGR